MPLDDRTTLPKSGVTGSIVESKLLDVTAKRARRRSAKLAEFLGAVDDTGEGRWTPSRPRSNAPFR